MFKALADEGINIQMISTSEIKISVVLDEKYLELAVRVLHRTFGLDQVSLTAGRGGYIIRASVEEVWIRRRGREVEGTPLLREHAGIQPMRFPAHLHHSKHGILHLRLTVPKDLRPVLGRREIKPSLQIRDAVIAQQWALGLNN